MRERRFAALTSLALVTASVAGCGSDHANRRGSADGASGAAVLVSGSSTIPTGVPDLASATVAE